MTSKMTSGNDRLSYWNTIWTNGETPFHKLEIHPYMSKHIDKLLPNGKANKILFPLCGKAVDMKWLADQGFNIVGVDGVEQPLKEFFEQNGLEYLVEDLSHNTHSIRVYKSKDDKIRLYCCDIMNFTRELEGTIDAVWDRGALEALERSDVPQYVQVIKSLLNDRSRILVELMEYDIIDFQPPPFSMREEELKKLFEPEYVVESVERGVYKARGHELCGAYYLIKKS